jgi:serine/threonine protein kinase
MARFLGTGCVLKSPRTIRAYTVAEAPQWQGSSASLRPPAHIIGVGGFGVTYRVVDDRGAAFAMKEYFPRDHAVRGADGRIVPKRSEDGFSRKIFEEGLRRFVAEGDLLSSFVHRNVSRVVDSFDDNGTSYQLMKLVEGRETLGESDTGAARIERRVTLEDFLRELERPESGTPIDLPLLEPVLLQLLAAVEYIHTEGTRKAQEITGAPIRALLHRDIKPQNILIEAPAGISEAPAAEVLRHPDTVVTLIDFGSARLFRDAQDDDVSRSIGVVTEGYAPPELKDNQLEQQGPHSDIYSLAAVIWRALVGRKPTTAQLANGAKLADLAQPVRGPDGVTRARAPKAFLQAVDRALNAAVGLRPQSVAQWRQELWGGRPVRQRSVRRADGGRAAPPRRGRALAFSLAVAAALAVALLWYNAGGPERNIERQSGLAYDDAQKAATLAGDVSSRAAQAAKDAAGLFESAAAKAADGRDRFTRFQAFDPVEKVYHDKDSGSLDYGDKYVAFTWPNGATANLWCYKPRPDITAENPSDPQTWTVAGDTGWACASAHTHNISREFAEEKNPWRIEGAGYNYNGEVDATAQKASGLGQIQLGDRMLTGRFTPAGSDYDVLGALMGSEGLSRVGRLRLSMAANPPTALDWLGQEYESAKVTFEGHATPDQKLGKFKGEDGEFLGVAGARGVALGKLTQPDGTTIYASGGGGDNPDQGWGRIDTTQAIYTGQIGKAKPEGCGIWEQSGKKEVGFYVAGVKREGPLPDSCRRLRYQSPTDMAALAQANAADGSK